MSRTNNQSSTVIQASLRQDEKKVKEVTQTVPKQTKFTYGDFKYKKQLEKPVWEEIITETEGNLYHKY